MNRFKNCCDCNIIHEDKVMEVKNNMIDKDLLLEVKNFFKIIGDETRVKILFALDKSELCVCDIANILNMSKSSISHQLSFLKENVIIKSKKVGKEVIYSLCDNHIKDVFEVALNHVSEKRLR